MSDGGFPLQMGALGSLFDSMTLVTVGVPARNGGVPLPAGLSVVPLRKPAGQDWRRKLDVVLRSPGLIRALIRELKAADAVHTPLPGDIPLIAFAVALFLRKPLIARYGGSWLPTSETTLANRVTRTMMRAYAGGRNVMLATGLSGSSEGPAPGISWIFVTAISEAEIAGVNARVDRDAQRPLRLIYPGRLSPEKGVLDLVEAVAGLRQRLGASIPAPRLRLVGDGIQRDAIESRIRSLGCAEFVSLAGQRDRAGLIRELQDADVCVLPSLSESFCKARLDAMLCGVPVVTTPVGFGREIVGADGERGWIVPPGDPKAISEVLLRLVSVPQDWGGIRRRCREFVEGRTLERWADEIAGHCVRQWKVRFEEGRLRP
jgi:glycosyltransferase involved in cell wall biosynthesis